jgi:hypothetical protein
LKSEVAGFKSAILDRNPKSAVLNLPGAVMSRIPTGDMVPVPPSNNVYTVLAALGTVVVAIGLIVLFVRANALGVELLKF